MPAKKDQTVLSNGKLKRPAAATATRKWYETNNVYLFIPNLIGYFRIFLAGASLYYMSKHPITCILLYGVSCILDALDGYCARLFNQSTKFGAVLDMVTDRCTTACLLLYLSIAYPKMTILFQALVSLDLASHYMHMYAMMERGSGSHKSVERSQSWILNQYYSNNKVLFTICAMNELFFVSLYLYSFPYPHATRDPIMGFIVVMMCANFPVCALKQWISIVQMYRAAETLVAMDVERRQIEAAKKK